MFEYLCVDSLKSFPLFDVIKMNDLTKFPYLSCISFTYSPLEKNTEIFCGQEWWKHHQYFIFEGLRYQKFDFLNIQVSSLPPNHLWAHTTSSCIATHTTGIQFLLVRISSPHLGIIGIRVIVIIFPWSLIREALFCCLRRKLLKSFSSIAQYNVSNIFFLIKSTFFVWK